MSKGSLYCLIVIGMIVLTVHPAELQVWKRSDNFQNTERARHVSPPPGYTYLPHSAYYKFHSQQVPWLLASYTCLEEGGHLVVFNSEAEAKFVTGLWDSTSQWAWIGTHDLFQEGVYVTIYNQTLQEAGYSKTYPGEPNGGVNENCGLVNKNAQLGNGFCHLPVPFICEINLEH